MAQHFKLSTCPTQSNIYETYSSDWTTIPQNEGELSTSFGRLSRAGGESVLNQSTTSVLDSSVCTLAVDQSVLPASPKSGLSAQVSRRNSLSARSEVSRRNSTVPSKDVPAIKEVVEAPADAAKAAADPSLKASQLPTPARAGARVSRISSVAQAEKEEALRAVAELRQAQEQRRKKVTQCVQALHARESELDRVKREAEQDKQTLRQSHEEEQKAWQRKVAEAEVRVAAVKELAAKSQADSERMLTEVREAEAQEKSVREEEFSKTLAEREAELERLRRDKEAAEKWCAQSHEAWQRRLAEAEQVLESARRVPTPLASHVPTPMGSFSDQTVGWMAACLPGGPAPFCLEQTLPPPSEQAMSWRAACQAASQAGQAAVATAGPVATAVDLAPAADGGGAEEIPEMPEGIATLPDGASQLTEALAGIERAREAAERESRQAREQCASADEVWKDRLTQAETDMEEARQERDREHELLLKARAEGKRALVDLREALAEELNTRVKEFAEQVEEINRARQEVRSERDEVERRCADADEVCRRKLDEAERILKAAQDQQRHAEAAATAAGEKLLEAAAAAAASAEKKEVVRKVARVSQALRQIDETRREAFRECAQVDESFLTKLSEAKVRLRVVHPAPPTTRSAVVGSVVPPARHVYARPAMTGSHSYHPACGAGRPPPVVEARTIQVTPLGTKLGPLTPTSYRGQPPMTSPSARCCYTRSYEGPLLPVEYSIGVRSPAVASGSGVAPPLASPPLQRSSSSGWAAQRPMARSPLASASSPSPGGAMMRSASSTGGHESTQSAAMGAPPAPLAPGASGRVHYNSASYAPGVGEAVRVVGSGYGGVQQAWPSAAQSWAPMLRPQGDLSGGLPPPLGLGHVHELRMQDSTVGTGPAQMPLNSCRGRGASASWAPPLAPPFASVVPIATSSPRGRPGASAVCSSRGLTVQELMAKSAAAFSNAVATATAQGSLAVAAEVVKNRSVSPTRRTTGSTPGSQIGSRQNSTDDLMTMCSANAGIFGHQVGTPRIRL